MTNYPNISNLLEKRDTFPANNSLKFLLVLVCCITVTLCSSTATLSQSPTGGKWNYITSVTGGGKFYLNDEVKTLANKNTGRWEKLVLPDNSSAISLVEWDCANKRRLTQQTTFYSAAQTVITTKKQFEWALIIPGSTADILFRRVCSPPTLLQIAEITAAQANLRSLPDLNAPVLRIATRGEKFEIVPGTGKGGWYNVVDADTQEDFWLHDSTFKFLADKKQNKK